MNNVRKSIRLGSTLAVVALALAAGGCVDRSVKGDEITYGFSWWVPVITLLGAIVLLPAGWLLRNKSSRFGWAMILIAPVLALVVFPTTLTDKVRVDANHFESADGVWFMSTKHDVKFDDLHELRHVTYEERGRRGRKRTKQKFLCVRTGGVKENVSIGMLLQRAEEEIMERAKAKGVTVSFERP